MTVGSEFGTLAKKFAHDLTGDLKKGVGNLYDLSKPMGAMPPGYYQWRLRSVARGKGPQGIAHFAGKLVDPLCPGSQNAVPSPRRWTWKKH